MKGEDAKISERERYRPVVSNLPTPGHALLKYQTRSRVFVCNQYDAKVGQRNCLAKLITRVGAKESHALLRSLLSLHAFSMTKEFHCQKEQRVCQAHAITNSSPEAFAFLQPQERGTVVAHGPGQQTGGEKHLREKPCVFGSAQQCERRIDPGSAFTPVASMKPKPDQGATKSQRSFGFPKLN